jgi:preprotein translocase subunit SecA
MAHVRDYLRQYQRLAGMTGTAVTDALTYQKIYHLDVVPVPAGKPVIRVDHPDAVHRTTQAKLAALADQQLVVYARRRAAFTGEGLRDRIRSMIDEVIRAHVAASAGEHAEPAQLWRELRDLYPVAVTPEALAAQCGCARRRAHAPVHRHPGRRRCPAGL